MVNSFEIFPKNQNLKKISFAFINNVILIFNDLMNWNIIFFLTVNDEPVSDGAAGCDRAKLIMACAVENKAEV